MSSNLIWNTLSLLVPIAGGMYLGWELHRISTSNSKGDSESEYFEEAECAEMGECYQCPECEMCDKCDCNECKCEKTVCENCDKCDNCDKCEKCECEKCECEKCETYHIKIVKDDQAPPCTTCLICMCGSDCDCNEVAKKMV